MLAIRRLPHHPGPARWSIGRVGSSNLVKGALLHKSGNYLAKW